MKLVSYLSLLIGFFILSCSVQKDFVAEYDYDYRGNFKRYKTFDFVQIYGENDTTVFPRVIQNAITNRLNSQGFKQRFQSPDLLVNYKLYTSQVKYRGYEQPDFAYWLRKHGAFYNEDAPEDTIASKVVKRDEQYDKIKYLNNEGMLVIFVIDNRKGQTIWQGYTSAHFDPYSPNIKIDLTRATAKVMDQFKLVTNDYVIY